ncbi:prolyl aminopeptidase [Flocculibacter collagenilyticus]|uniref:prolyl aminopeptidase n=1 Tax=Flocculibacter collagenilyticus TaxID=2744479 RepID=UPI0018F33F41|nr:prolyl aminopeptidase [Flocculibacter collagenilyticus]
MSNIYPLIKANNTYQVNVSDGHTLYVEESGNSKGVPVIFLHGGPGGGCHPVHRSFYNPEFYRIILFDQRGCGQSTPYLGLAGNNSQQQIEDIEAIRKFLNIDMWLVCGGSWGSTLALLYAIEHANRVKGLILRGVFLARKEDTEWMFSPTEGASQLFPDYHEKLLQPLTSLNAHNHSSATSIIDNYYTLLTGEDEVVRIKAAKHWASWEGKIATVNHAKFNEGDAEDPHSALSLALLECHYFYHHFFIEENFIINHAAAFAHIPGYIVHGRYDTVCKLDNAWQLAKHWPEAQLQIIPAAGHSATDPSIAKALCLASDAMAKYFIEKSL